MQRQSYLVFRKSIIHSDPADGSDEDGSLPLKEHFMC